MPLTGLRRFLTSRTDGSTDCATLRSRERTSAPGVAPVANEMWLQPRRRCRRSGEMWSHGPAGAAVMEKCGHTSFFWCMVAFRLAADRGSMHEVCRDERAQGAFSELVRAAANGELIVLTDYGKPLAVITSIEDEGANRADDSADASKFRQALLALPHHLDVNF